MQNINELIANGYARIGTFGFSVDILAKGNDRILYDTICNVIVAKYDIKERKPQNI
jgi:hypothetical protein